MDVCYFYLLPVGPFSEARQREQKINSRRRRRKWRRGRRKKGVSTVWTFSGMDGRMLHKLFSSGAAGTTVSKEDTLKHFLSEALFSRWNRRVAANVDKNALMYAQPRSSAHVHMLVMCNPNFFWSFLCLWFVSRDNVCGHDNGKIDEWTSFWSKLMVPVFQFHFSGCWFLLFRGVTLLEHAAQTLTVCEKIIVICLISSHGNTDISFNLYSCHCCFVDSAS